MSPGKAAAGAVAKTAGAMLHLYAMYLPAQFQEQAAYPMLVQIFSTPGEVCFDVRAIR